MSEQYSNAPMLEMYIFETSSITEQLEQIMIECEKEEDFSSEAIGEIFRCMHTIKGSSAMMLFNDISTLAHSMEDIFYLLREDKPQDLDTSTLSDLIFEGLDFIKEELEKIKAGQAADGDASIIIEKNKEFMGVLKMDGAPIDKPASSKKTQYYIAPDSKKRSKLSGNYYKATIYFEDGCEMENVRAFAIVHNFKDSVNELYFIPEDIIENEQAANVIKENGFIMLFETDKSKAELDAFFAETLFMKEVQLVELADDSELQDFRTTSDKANDDNCVHRPVIVKQEAEQAVEKTTAPKSAGKGQGIISVNVEKLDALMDIVGEIVIAEAMVTQNPEIQQVQLDQFHTAARQLHKITIELQDIVMSIRMVPLSTTFLKMHRILRDMSKKLNKDVELVVIGEETEVDKNIIENIGDPLMHLIRNAIDHGIEHNDEREQIGKPRAGKITIEAKNSGSDVLILIKDDGKGLDKQKIYDKAKKNGIIDREIEDMSERDIFGLILKPGFSMKEQVTEFSGRGVGMDVVVKNLESVGGSVVIDSEQGKGTTITMKIPLTLAIIEGMNCRVGKSSYTIPIINIRESFQPRREDYITDPDGQEIIMVRGQCIPIIRLHEQFNIADAITGLGEGILIMVEQDEKTVCLLVDELLGQQQVVVKALPNYIKKLRPVQGLAGCTLLGDGSISLIIDVGGMIARKHTKRKRSKGA